MRKLLLILALLFVSVGIASCTGNQSITVSFESNGGNEIEDMVIGLNSTSVDLPTPTRQGYTFIGWYLDENYNEPFTIAALLTQTGALTLYAKWDSDALEFTITFESNGGSAVTAITQAENTTVAAPANPTKTGFTFGGWYSDAGLVTAYTFSTMPGQNITLYAKWNPAIVQQTITFESNGGSAVQSITQNVGSAVTAPSNPTKTGFIFGGWYSDAGLTTAYTFSTMPSAAMTLYAKWNPVIVQQTITFESNGGSTVQSITQNVGSAVTAPSNPTKTGFTFGGWYSDVGLVTAYTFSTMPSASITLYAKWTANIYTITFEENGGSTVTNITQAYGSIVASPANPTKDGYTFGGWYSDTGLVTAYTFTTMPLNGITLYAKWTANNYTITFEENGGSTVTNITQSFGSTVTSPANPTKDGYTFGGWYSDTGLLTAYTFATMPLNGITLYAKWNALTYTITFMNAEGVLPLELVAGATISLPTPTKTGYLFDEWYEDSYFIIEFTSLVMPAHNLTIYAKWTPQNYPITFVIDGQTTITGYEAPYGQDIPFPEEDPNKVGFVFVGWYLNDTFTQPAYEQVMPAQAITIYAKWIAETTIWTIEDILTYEPEHMMLQGTIVYKFVGPNQGYYVADETGIILVTAPTALSLGTIVEFEADFNMHEYVPELINISNLVVITEGTPTVITYVETPISTLIHLDYTDPFVMSKPVIIQGLLTMEGPNYKITEPGSGAQVFINFKSYDMMNNPFTGLVGSLIKIRALVYGFDPMMENWQVLYDPSAALETITLSDQEKVDELLDFATTMLHGEDFYSNQKLELPSSEPVYGATLLFVTTGENASYFNPSTGEFLPTEIERQITIHLTVTVNDKTGFADIVITLKPVIILSIAEFMALDDVDYGLVEGIVIFSVQEMSLMIITDDTGAILPIQTTNFAEVGDFISVDGYKNTMMDLVIMMGSDDQVVTVTDTGLSNPITPIELTVSQFINLDVMQSLYWGRYFEVMGTLEIDDLEHTITLNFGIDELPIMVLSQEVYQQLSQFDGLELSLRGFALPNFDNEPVLMFIFTGQMNDIVLDYTNQELLDMISPELKAYLEGQSFAPGQALDLPTEHDIFLITVSYQVDPLDIELVSQEWVISNAITEDTTITLHATLYLGDATKEITILIHVAPMSILSIEEFLQLTDENLHYVQGVVIFVDHSKKFMIIADETGVIMAPVDMPAINQGDFVLLYGMKMESEGMLLVGNDPTKIVIEVIGTNYEIPFVPEMYTLEELIENKLTEPSNYLEYVEVFGTLRKDGMNEIYYLENDLNQQLYVFTMMVGDLSSLNAAVGLEIRISGFLMYVSDENMTVLVFLNTGDDIKNGFTDQELVLYIKNKLESVFLDKVMRPGATVQLPTSYLSQSSLITYEVYGENSALYDLATGTISNTITEHTEINLRATITSGEETEIAEFIFVVEPIVTQTIAEFLAGEENDSFIVKGVVILTKFMDGPIIITDGVDVLFIVKDLDVKLGDEIIVEGVVTIEQGMKMMVDDESTVLLEIISEGLANPFTPEVMTITAFNALDIDDVNNWGRYVEVIGYPTYSKNSNFPLLKPELSSSEFVPIVPVYLLENYYSPDYNLLYMYNGFRVVVKGFLLPNFNDYDPYAPDRIILISNSDYMYADYYTDLDKMNAVIALGEAQLESKIFHPGQEMSLPDEIQAVGAHIVWSFIGDVSGIYDIVNEVFLEITEPVTINLQAIVTIGSLTQEHIFVLNVAPYTLISIQDVYDLEDGEFAKVQGVVVKKINENAVILQQTGSDIYLFVEEFNGNGGLGFVNLGDVLLVFGTKHAYSGSTYLSGGDEDAYMTNKGSGTPESLIITQANLSDVAQFNENDTIYTRYYELKGRLIREDEFAPYYLTNGTHTIFLETLYPSIADEFALYIGHDVMVRMFLYDKTYTSMGDVWKGLVVDEAVIIDDIVFTNEEILSFMSMYVNQLSFLDYKDGLSYYLPSVHPIYGGSYTYEVQTLDSDKATVTGNMINFTSSVDDYTVVLNVTCTYDSSFRTDPYTLSVYSYNPYVPNFVPGSKTMIPELLGETPAGEFVGLYINTVQRENSIGGGDRMVVDFYFPEAYLLGASYHMIQVYNSVTQVWEYIQDGDGPISTDWNNFSLNFNSGATVRLITDTNLVSNTVTFEYTDIDTRFAGWYLDMGMMNTGIMMPFVGYGLLLDNVAIYDLMGNLITGGYTVNWYRVNPYTFELTPIEGQHNHSYTTTMADVGYLLMVEIKGDGVNVGGFERILVEESTRIFNSGFVRNVTNMGFDIGFEYNISLSMLEDLLEIRSYYGDVIPFVTITTTDTPYVYHVNVNLSDYEEIFIEVKNNAFITGSEEDYHMWEIIQTYIYEW